jgi:hypothetical protein
MKNPEKRESRQKKRRDSVITTSPSKKNNLDLEYLGREVWAHILMKVGKGEIHSEMNRLSLGVGEDFEKRGHILKKVLQDKSDAEPLLIENRYKIMDIFLKFDEENNPKKIVSIPQKPKLSPFELVTPPQIFEQNHPWTEEDQEFFCGRTLEEQVELEKKLLNLKNQPDSGLGFDGTALRPFPKGSKWYRCEHWHRKNRFSKEEVPKTAARPAIIHETEIEVQIPNKPHKIIHKELDPEEKLSDILANLVQSKALTIHPFKADSVKYLADGKEVASDSPVGTAAKVVMEVRYKPKVSSQRQTPNF